MNSIGKMVRQGESGGYRNVGWFGFNKGMKERTGSDSFETKENRNAT